MRAESAVPAARAIIQPIEAGTEEIFLDPMSRNMGGAYRSDPKGLERRVAATAA